MRRLEAIEEHETELGRRFLEGCPAPAASTGRGHDGQVPTFAFNAGDRALAMVAAHLAGQNINMGSGNYYSPAAMEALGAGGIGISHYNTAEEVERLLAALEDVSTT